MTFNKINIDTWPRREHFKYYMENIKCKYNMNAEIDITRLLEIYKKHGLKFYPCFIYVVSIAISKNIEFKMSYNEKGQLGYFENLNPVYTIFHEDDKTFSDIWTEFSPDFSKFYSSVIHDMDHYKNTKGIKAKPNQPKNFYPISAVPWISFTGYSNISFDDSKTLFPIVTFGKYFKRHKKTLIPFSILVNHAAADGYHTSKLINDIQYYAAHPEKWIST